MDIHYIENTDLKKITDAIKYKNRMTEGETFSGADIPDLIKKETLLRMVLNGEVDENGTLYDITEDVLEGLDLTRSYTFYDVKWLRKIILPETLGNIGNNAFNACTNLEEVHLPSNLKGTGTGGFSNCYKLITINVESLEDVGVAGFRKCYELEKLDFHKLTSIGAQGFADCSKLSALIIRTDSVCRLSDINALTGTPIANGTGYIYFHSAQIENYKVATNWNTYSAQFRAIEDYPEICGGI